MSDEEVVETTEETVEPIGPMEVKIVKEPEKKEPDFDHDNYLPSEDEIIETEKEIHEQEMKRKVNNA